MGSPRPGVALLSALCLAACNTKLSVTTAKLAPSASPRVTVAGSTAPAPSSTPTPALTSPTSSPTATPGLVKTVSSTGQVLGLDGQPAAGVVVRAFLVSDQGAGLITDQGAGLVGNNAGNMISNNAGNLVSEHGGAWHMLADLGASAAAADKVASGPTGPATAIMTTTTDAQGNFTLGLPTGSKANVEAVQSDAVKAIAQSVATTDGLAMQLAYTGSISGKVTSDNATDLTGVDVFVPGTSYGAKCAADGSYTITNVPVGSFLLVGMHAGLGRGSLAGVVVKPRAVTPAPDLHLVVNLPLVQHVSPPNAGPGASVTLTGSHFGFADGSTFTVRFGGATASGAQRTDDGTIQVAVPAGATTGDLVVDVAGAQSKGVPFTVLGSIAFPPNPGDLPLGFAQPYPALTFDAAGKPVAAPALTWTSDGPALTVDAQGLVKAVSVGQATLTAKSGSVTASLAATIVNEPVFYQLAGGNALDYVDGPGKTARFRWAGAVCGDKQGTVFVADYQNNAVRAIRPDGFTSTVAGGPNSTLKLGAGAGDDKGGLAVDDADNLYVAAGPQVLKIAPDGSSTVVAGGSAFGDVDGPAAAARFEPIVAIARDPAGTLFLAEGADPKFHAPYPSAHRIRKIALDGTVSTVAGSVDGVADGSGATALFSGITSLTMDGLGLLYASDAHGIRKIGLDGSVTTLPTPTGFQLGSRVVADAAGNLYTADFYTGLNSAFTYRKVAVDGTVTVLGTVQGWGKALNGPASVASDWGAYALALDGHGDLLVSNYQDEANTSQVKRVLLPHTP